MIESLHRLTRRTDVRSAVLIASILVAGITLQNVILYAFVAMEAVEEADHWLSHGLRALSRDIEIGNDPRETLEAIGLSLGATPAAARLSAGGVALWSSGDWPPAERTSPHRTGEDTRSLSDFGLLEADRFLSGTTQLSGGRALTLVIPVAHFASEVREVGWGLLAISLLSAALALLVAVGATFWAFKPLRDATALLADVGVHQSGRRLPSRGTNDAVDLHARLLNEILADVDESFSRLRAFSSDVAHELRTPLNRMAAVADVASDEGADEVRTALNSIRSTNYDLTRMVDALLLISELDAGGRRLDLDCIDAGKRVAEAASLYAPSFEDRGSELRVEAVAATARVVPELLDRVIFNLLENALLHTPPGSRVAVTCRPTQGGLTITVEDDGEGIAEDRLEAVFDRFSRSHRSDSPGHGLGLAIARTIARSHGGDIEAERSELGGARFVWRMPHAPPWAESIAD